MATGTLRFQAPNGSIIERPQEEFQSLRQAGFKPMSGQTISGMSSSGIKEIPVESLMRIAPTEMLPIERQSLRFARTAEERYGGPTGMLKTAGAGLARGLTSGAAEGAAIDAGLVKAEDVAMMREANPITSGVSELGGAVLQGLATTAATGGGGAPVAAASLGTLAKRGLAMGIPYGLGSEYSESRIQGREADYGRGALVGAAGGLIGEGVAAGLGKTYPKVKGFIEGLRSEESKILSAEKGLAQAQKALDKANTAEQRAAAQARVEERRSALFDLQQAKTKGKVDAATQIQDAAIRAGEDAKVSVDKVMADTKVNIDGARQWSQGALDAQNELQATLKKAGLNTDVDKAAYSLGQRFAKNVKSLMSVDAELTTHEALKRDITTIVDAADSFESLMAKAASERDKAVANAKGIAAQIEKEKLAGRTEKSLLDSYARQSAEELRAQQFGELADRTRAQFDSIANYAAAKEGHVAMVQAVGGVDRELAKEARKLASLRQVAAESAVSTDVKAAADETLASAADAATKLKANVPNATTEAGVTFGKKMIRKDLQEMTQDSLNQVLENSAKEGGVSLRRMVHALLSETGASIDGTLAGTTANKIVSAFEQNPNIIGLLPVSERKGMIQQFAGKAKQFKGGDYTFRGKSASKYRSSLQRLLATPDAGGVPLTTLEDIAAARAQISGSAAGAAPTEAVIAEKVTNPRTPELTAETDEAIRASLQRQEMLGTQREMMGNLRDANQQEMAESLRKVAEAKKASATAPSMAKAEDAMRRQIVEDLNQARIQQNAEQIGGLQDKLSKEQLRAVTQGAEASSAAADLQYLKRQAANLKQSADLERKISLARGAKGEAERKVAEDIATAAAVDKLRPGAEAAAEFLRQAEAKMPGIITKGAASGNIVQGGEALLKKQMDTFFKTPEGKKLASAIASAEKAAEAKSAAEFSAKAMEDATGDAVTRVKNAFSNPSVIAASVAGGPAAVMSVMAVALASGAPMKGVRQMLSALSPQFMIGTASKLTDLLMKESLAKTVSRRLTATKALEAITRPEVERVKNEVDQIIADQDLARQVFKNTANSFTFPMEMYNELENRYMSAVSELQKRRPQSFGKGPISAEEEEFVRAFRTFTDPESLVRSMQAGGISKAQSDMLKQISPDSYEALNSALQGIQQNSKSPIQTPTANIMKVSMSTRGRGLGVGGVQQYIGMAAQPQEQGLSPGSKSLGTRRPSSGQSLGKTLAGEE